MRTHVFDLCAHWKWGKIKSLAYVQIDLPRHKSNKTPETGSFAPKYLNLQMLKEGSNCSQKVPMCVAWDDLDQWRQFLLNSCACLCQQEQAWWKKTTGLAFQDDDGGGSDDYDAGDAGDDDNGRLVS